VRPSNGEDIIRQWTNVYGLSESPSHHEFIENHTRRVWSDPNGNALIEAFFISGMMHGVPLATTTGERCGSAGEFFLDVGISSTHHIARFFRLHEFLVEMPRAAAPVSTTIQIPTDGGALVTEGTSAEGVHSSAGASLAEGEKRQALPARPQRRDRGGVQGRRSPGAGAADSAARHAAARCARPDHRGGLESRRTGAELIRPSARPAADHAGERGAGDVA
jgi:hypothetical protein